MSEWACDTIEKDTAAVGGHVASDTIVDRSWGGESMDKDDLA